jgi:PKD repeat protein
MAPLAANAEPSCAHLRQSPLRLYVNGVQVSSVAQTSSVATWQSSADWRSSIYGQYFKGSIDEVRVYNRALSQAEIQTDMNTPVASGGASPAAPVQNFTAASGAAPLSVAFTNTTTGSVTTWA